MNRPFIPAMANTSRTASKSKLPSVIAFCVLLFPSCVLAATIPQFEVIDVTNVYVIPDSFNPIPYPYFGPVRINNSNQIIGAVPVAKQHKFKEFQGFLWQDGVFQGLGTGVVEDINDFGDYIGSVTGAVLQAVAPSLNPHAINNAGQVVGEMDDHAFLWDSNGMVPFPTDSSVSRSIAYAVNNFGVATGTASINGGKYVPFLFTSDASMAIGPTTNTSWSRGVAINDAGHVALVVMHTNGSSRRLCTYLYRDGELTQLRSIRGLRHVRATAMNNSDEIIGYAGRTARDHFSTSRPRAFLMTVSAGFLYSNGEQHNLDRLLTKSSRGWHVSEPLDINDSGSIVARASWRGKPSRVVMLRRVLE